MSPEQLCIWSKWLILNGNYLNKLLSEWLGLEVPLGSKRYLQCPQYASFQQLQITGKHTDNEKRSFWNPTFPWRTLSLSAIYLDMALGSCRKHTDCDATHSHGGYMNLQQILGHFRCVSADLMPCIWISAEHKPFLFPALLGSRTAWEGVNHGISSRLRAGSTDIFTI